jgi:hypothetical protein
MTEAEWLACVETMPMLEFLRDKISDRKLRLFGVACARRVWPLLADDRSRRAIEVAEQLAEGLVNEEERQEAFRSGMDVVIEKVHQPYGIATTRAMAAYRPAFRQAMSAALYAAESAAGSAGSHGRRADWNDRAWRHKEQVVLAREIFGNPFRPVIITPAWLTFTVVQLSQAIYAERAFDRMPILADALEDAGCNNGDVLMHCRSGGEHCRGCWVVDLLLGKQ